MTENVNPPTIPYENPLMPDKLLQVQAGAEAAAAGLKVALAAGKVSAAPVDPDQRTFISPTQPNTQFLVKIGTLVQFRDPNSPSGTKDVRRDGDIWAEFHSGVCTSRVPEVIEWCEAHSGSKEDFMAYHQRHGSDPRNDPVGYGMCRDIRTPGVEGWAELKAQQIPLAHRDASISPNMDVDAMFAGVGSAMRPDVRSRGQVFVEAGRNSDAAERERWEEFDK